MYLHMQQIKHISEKGCTCTIERVSIIINSRINLNPNSIYTNEKVRQILLKVTTMIILYAYTFFFVILVKK